MPTVSRPVTNAPHGPIFIEQFLNGRAHKQTKRRIAFGLVGDELEKLSLGQHHDVGKLLLDSTEISKSDQSVGRSKRRLADLAVAKFVKPIGQSEFIHDV